MAHSRAGGVGVKFALPDAELDEEERYLSQYAKFEPQTFSSTDDDSNYSMDRLNSSDFFDAPEAAITVPQPRIKRLSQEKNRGHNAKSRQDEKDTKRRIQMAREHKQSEVKLYHRKSDEQIKKRPSKTESKLRHKSRSIERDDKTDEKVARPASSVIMAELNGTQQDFDAGPSLSGGLDALEASAPAIPTLMESSRQRHGSGERPESDSERKMFHKKFILAMKLGRRAYRDREERGRTIPDKFPYQRQYSDIIYNGRDKMNHESLFMAILAYRKRMPINDCYEKMWELRDKVPDKIKEIEKFQFTPEQGVKFIDNNICDLLTNSFNITDDYLDTIEAAIDQVKEILESIELLQSLFPTIKSMRREYEVCASKDYQKKVSTLNMWLNNAEALISGITTVGVNVGVEKLPYIQWPFLENAASHLQPNANSLTSTDSVADSASVPESPSADDSGSANSSLSASGMGHKCKVTFDACTPLSSSPAGTSNNLNLPISPSSDSKPMLMNNSFGTIDIDSPTSFYRPNVDRSLRKKSLMATIESKVSALKPLLRAKYGIIKMEMEPVIDISGQKTLPVMKTCDVLPLTPAHDLISIDDKVQQHESVDDDYTSFYDEFKAMNLPSLMPMYIFLARFPLDYTHESLRLRLEQQIEHPSLPIIRQVVHECSEAAKVATTVKQSYQYLLTPVIKKYSITDETFERYVERFNADLKEILQVYFGYVEYGMCTLKKETTPHSLKGFLEEEWTFSKETCPYITGGMAEAGKRFCGMCSILLQSIQSQLEQELDEALFKSNHTGFSDGGLSSPTLSDTCANDICTAFEQLCTTADYRQMLMQSCREIKTLFTEMREWASKALGFAKLLRKDLEIAAEFRVKVKSSTLMHVLQTTGHVKVITPHTANYIILVPNIIKDDKHSLLTLLDVTCGREDTGATSTREGYMLLINTGDNKVKWKGPEIHVDPKTETTIALSHIGVDGLFLIVTHSSQLHRQRKEFCVKVGEAVELVNEQTTCHQAIAQAWNDLRTNAFELASAVKSAIEHVENQLDSTDLDSLDTDSDRKTIKGAYKETLHQCYSFGFEFLQEYSRLNSSRGLAATQKDEILLAFAHQWMQFVISKCERGKGTRPRWANPGFDFLSVVIDPSITRSLTDEEFDALKKKVEDVVKHIIGEINSSTSHSPKLDKKVSLISTHRFLSMTEPHNRMTRRQISSSSSGSRKGVMSEPPTPYDRLDDARGMRWYRQNDQSVCSLAGESPNSPTAPYADSCRSRTDSSASSIHSVYSIPESPTFPAEMMPPERSQAAVNKLERARDESLREKKIIGRITEGQHHTSIVRINVRKVNFKWQRGTKIGEGQFGIVYTAINCDTNCMMAMKELRFQPNDVQTIKSIADELRTFEGINHPNLVKYFGIEVHKEEIFIFMEYCNEGTLEDMSKIGLTESLIRRYTRELVTAIDYLHEHNIIHRDIKGANIFLVSNDKLKLGDFGCSAKLKEHTTMPGEMLAFVGTAAFMAPEVITQKGYGRSADIWSLGCVIIEMTTGKRPWWEMENMHQIMFKVGMGNIPPTPENFHQEGRDFLDCCFEVEPEKRSTANELLGHTFVKVRS